MGDVGMKKMVIGLLIGVLAACMQLKYEDDDEQMGTKSSSSSRASGSSSSIYSKLQMGKLDTTSKKGISYYEAIIRCNKMSREENLDSLYQYDKPEYIIGDSIFWLPNITILEGRSGYRLPTKEEWNKAYENDEIKDVDKNIGEWLNKEVGSQYSAYSIFEIATFEIDTVFYKVIGLYKSKDSSLVYGMRAVKVY